MGKLDAFNMESIILKVQKNQILILENVSVESKNYLEKEIEKYSEIRFYAILTGHSFQIILNVKRDSKDIDDSYFDKIRFHYIHKNYDTCIHLLKKLYCSSSMPTVYPLYKIGLCYDKLFQKKLAISFLRVANAMNQELEEMKDFSNFLFSLQGLLSDDDHRLWCVVKEEEFVESLENLFSVYHFEEIKKLVLHLDMHIEDACFHFGLTDEEFNIVKLLIAKEYYKMGKFHLGDMYYNMPVKGRKKREM